MANLRTRNLFLALGWAMLASVACGSDEDQPLFVTMQERQLTAQGWEQGGGGCMSVSFGDDGPSSGSSSEGSAGSGPLESGGQPPSPLTIERSPTPEGLRVVVTSGAQPLAIKVLTQEFLESGEIYRFEVTTPDGVRHQFAHRGAHVCESDVDLFAE
jgi:hypothetical protein